MILCHFPPAPIPNQIRFGLGFKRSISTQTRALYFDSGLATPTLSLGHQISEPYLSITILWNLNNYCRLDRKKDRDCKLLLKQRQIFKSRGVTRLKLKLELQKEAMDGMSALAIRKPPSLIQYRLTNVGFLILIGVNARLALASLLD